MPRRTHSAIPSDRFPNPNPALARALHIHYGMQRGMSRDEAVWHAESIIGPLEAKYFGRGRRSLQTRASAKRSTSNKKAPSGASKRRPSSARSGRTTLGGKRGKSSRPSRSASRPSRSASRGPSRSGRPTKGRSSGRNVARPSRSSKGRRVLAR